MLVAAHFDLVNPADQKVGSLMIRCRSGREKKGAVPLLEQLKTGDRIALLEESEYLYEFELAASIDSIQVQPRELFDPDDASGFRGRLKTSDHVGEIWVRALDANRELGASRLEVRASKLDYETDYQRMLSSIATDAAELLMQRFSPSSAEFTTAEGIAKVLYQRFAFLQSALNEDLFDSAIQEILRRPHHTYEGETHEVVPGRGAKTSSQLSRQFSSPGPKVPWPGGVIPDLPARFAITRFESTNDTEPNRFVKFVLIHWRSVCVDIHERLNTQDFSAPVERGLRETSTLIDRLDQVLAHPMFRHVAALRHVPIANQTLQKREGYRELLRLFVQSEAAARLNWPGAEDVFGAGQRNASTLYEYWVYLQFRKILSKFCTRELSLGPLFEVSPDGLVLSLKRGKSRVLQGSLERLGRQMSVELWFNRRFRSESWTRDMWPDCSLLISSSPGIGRRPLETWLHFDAKYRVEQLNQLFGEDELKEADKKSDEKRADLLKMHAYRDAIRRSSGAYVLYPGEAHRERADHRRYKEILPGLGAFPLRPGPDGDADPSGAFALVSFLDRVLTHAASQATQRERISYWESVVHQSEPVLAEHALDFLDQPPADTPVLLGYVKSDEHLDWIHRNRLYNLRADQRTGSVLVDAAGLGARFIMLYGSFPTAIMLERTDEPILLTADEMVARGYPHPRGELYCCLRIAGAVRLSFDVPSEIVSDLAILSAPDAPRGTPILTTWDKVQVYVERRQI